MTPPSPLIGAHHATAHTADDGGPPALAAQLAGSKFWRRMWKAANAAHLAPTFSRAVNDEGFAYGRGYMSIRRLAGMVGLFMPISLVVYDAATIKGRGISVKGSVSAYYFSDARDLFVGCLFAVGFLLITYMAGQWNTADYWLSVFGGIGVLVVANLPTRPPGITHCQADPRPLGCSFVQHKIGEDATWWIHTSGAGLFVICSIGLSMVFALREVKYAMRAHGPDSDRSRGRRMFFVYVALAAATAVFGLVALGPDFSIAGLRNIWLGELGAFTCFAVSWLLAGRLRTPPGARADGTGSLSAAGTAELTPLTAPRPEAEDNGAQAVAADHLVVDAEPAGDQAPEDKPSEGTP